MKNVTGLVALIIAVIALSIAVIPYLSGTKTSPISLGNSPSPSCINPTIISGNGQLGNFEPNRTLTFEVDVGSNGILTGQVTANESGTFYFLNQTQYMQLGNANIPSAFLYSSSGTVFQLNLKLGGQATLSSTTVDEGLGKTQIEYSLVDTQYYLAFYNSNSHYAKLAVTEPIEEC